MKKLIFATNNSHKLEEIKKMLLSQFELKGLSEMGIQDEIPEDHFTLKENAFQKASYIFEKYGYSCFADDTGLEIDALNGEPGVFSARYSRMGEPVYPEMDVVQGNIRKVLEKLQGKENRSARFRTVIALIIEGKKYSFEGVVEGVIIDKLIGKDGFGYDPIFMPIGYNETFAEMELSVKNTISHRALAVQKLVEFLSSMDQ